MVESPAFTLFGLAEPVPEGFVGCGTFAMHVESAFCGALGEISAKSAALSSVSVPFPNVPPGFRS